MRKTILVAVAAIAFSGSAYALESGATCDAEEDIEQQIVFEGTTPTPDQSPAPGSWSADAVGPSHLLPLLTQGHNHVVTYPVDS